VQAFAVEPERNPMNPSRPHAQIGFGPACLVALVGLAIWCVSRSASLAAVADPAENGPNLVKNGSFEEVSPDGIPAGWRTEGRKGIEQVITTDAGPERTKALRLTCTKFLPGFPDSHAMAASRGSVSLKKGRSYRLTWFARAAPADPESDPPFSAKVDISNTTPGAWKTEFGKAFRVYAYWKRYQLEFDSPDDLAAENSRLAFYMRSTGVLWLSDVSLVSLGVHETPVEWLPQIDTRNVTNLLPNSSFECGRAGWGGFSPELKGAGGTRTNLPEMPGDIDETTAWHGKRSLRIRLDKSTPLVMRTVVGGQVFAENALTQAVANVGWITLSANQSYAFSCYVKVEKPPVAVRLMVCKPGLDWPVILRSEYPIVVGTDWKRLTLTVRPTEDTPAWVAVGMDVGHTPATPATLWVDALQFEKGEQASAYAPHSAVESFVQSDVLGNIFTDPASGMDLSIRASNSGAEPALLKGRLSVTDFFDQEVLARDVELPLPAQGAGTAPLKGLLKGRKGFFRVAWKPQAPAAPMAQTLRCAIIDRYREGDSAFGMNNPYPWPLLSRLAKEGGLVWVRDWSAAWELVEPQQGKWDFSVCDARIDSDLAEGLKPLVLLPFPSAQWASSADRPTVDKLASRPWTRLRLICAAAAKDPNDLRTYVTHTVDHYKDRVGFVEIFNEPIYTEYSLPKQLGYAVKDYVEQLKLAWGAAKSAGPRVRVIGGIASHPDSPLVREFIDLGGLQSCDIMNLHWYTEAAAAPESGEKALAEIEEMMRTRRETRPIWMTEFGCYADDDPPFAPGYQIGGDDTMHRCNWPSERAAAADLVKYCTMLFAHGTRKVLFHTGNSGPINAGTTLATSDGDGVFFEYGGAPRKMYAAVSAMANLLGPDLEPAGENKNGALRAYWFRVKKGSAAVVWRNDFIQGAEEGKAVPLRLPRGVSALDLMGNKLEGETVPVNETPIYLQAADETVWKGMFQ